MKSPHDKSPPDRPEARVTTPDEGEEPEELTEERTIEWDVSEMSDALLEIAPEPPSPEPEEAIVSAPIEDESAGARSPRDLATRRHRRDTVPSLVPSILAKAAVAARRRDPPAPDTGAPRSGAIPPAATKTGQPQGRRPFADRTDGVPTRRDSDGPPVQRVAPRSPFADVHTLPTIENPVPVLGPVAMLVLKVRRCLQAGDVAQAVLAASGAMLASQSHAEPELGDLTDSIRGPLAPIFLAGPAGKIPVINRSEIELDGLTLDELGWALLRRLDGRSTLGQVLGATKIPPIEAMQLAASLLRDGVIRIDDRASP